MLEVRWDMPMAHHAGYKPRIKHLSFGVANRMIASYGYIYDYISRLAEAPVICMPQRIMRGCEYSIVSPTFRYIKI